MVWSGALLSALAYALRSCRRSGLKQQDVYWAGALAIAFGLWGGHLLGIYYYGTDGRPWAWIRLWSGGQAQYGGLVGGAIAVLLFLKLRRISILAYGDAIAPALALGTAIGRIGCFLNGDDFGTVSSVPWAVVFPPGTEAHADHVARGWISPADLWSLPVQPVQLYDSLLWLGFFAALAFWRPQQPGRRLALFAILQGLGRYTEQLFRGDFQSVIGPFSLTQLISLVFISVGLALCLYQGKAKQQPVEEAEIPAPMKPACGMSSPVTGNREVYFPCLRSTLPEKQLGSTLAGVERGTFFPDRG
jgi:phosphatidylglycerol:prolipoprotein diacylglycerol transferase